MLNGALPVFGLNALALSLALARAVAIGALFLVLGTLLIRVAIAAPLPAAVAPRLARLIRVALGVSTLAMLAWLLLQTAVITDASSMQAVLAGVPTVLEHTEFGTLVILRLLLLGAISLALAIQRPWAPLAATALTILAIGLQAGHLHGLSMYRGPSALLASEVLHVLAAAAWLGGLPGLLLVVRAAPPALAARATRRFSPVGAVCVLALAATAAWQSWTLLGGVPGALGTAYGWVCLSKALLFAVLLGFAARNRFRLVPRLSGPAPLQAQRALARSIAVEMAAGVLVVMLAALLSALEPGMHLQPVWPFRVRPSLMAVVQDPSLAREVALAGAAVLGALGLVVLGIARRRRRLLAFAAAAGIAWLAVPRLNPLFVPAFPTAFYRSPTGFAADSIADGAALFPVQCARCHGAESRGDGPDARLLSIAPMDLTSAHLWMHSDGELFWWLANGIEGPEGELAMPGFGDALDDEARWSLIDYIRARNAGLVQAATGRWSPPVLAPSFLADCGGYQAVPVAEPGGPVRRVVFLARGQAAPLPLTGLPDVPVVTVMLAAEHVMMQPTATACVASDPAIRAAYAVVTGLTASQLEGKEALIDGNGWLRAVQAQDSAPAATLRRIALAPLPRGSTFIMPHHH